MSRCPTCDRAGELVAIIGCPMFDCPRVAGADTAPKNFALGLNANRVVTEPELQDREGQRC
jgi:hypothetical protein